MEAFLLGVAAMLAWLYPSGADKVALRMVVKSFLIFVVGLSFFIFLGAIAVALLDLVWTPRPSIALGLGVAGVLCMVVMEEAAKLLAVQTEQPGIRTFALISLFGIWELMLSKPFVLELDRAAPLLVKAWELTLPLPAVALHFLTAATYAFRFPGSLRRQFTLCVAIHFAFNISRLLDSNVVLYGAGAGFAVATVLLIPKKNSPQRGRWNDGDDGMLAVME